MLKFIFSAIIVLSSMHALAQHSLKGLVRDRQSNLPLSDASVKMLVTRNVTVTDEFGQFLFGKLLPGVYQVRVSYVGYADQEQTVTIPTTEELILLLEQTSIITDEVVVNATRASDKTPSTYTNLNKEKIQKQNFGQDLPMLLNWTPSVVTTSDAGTGIGYTGIRIRGSDATRINVTINGIPYNDSESQGTFWVDVPDIASSAQSVQIQRGVGTSTNGAGAFGASINLQTTNRNDRAYAELVNSYGSFNSRRHTLSLGSGLLKDHWVIDGRISKIASHGFIDRASADLLSYYFSAGFYSDKSIVRLLSFGGKERTYQSWFGVPESRLKSDPEDMLITASNEGWNEEQTNNLLTSSSRTFNPYLYKNQVDDYAQHHLQLHYAHQFSDITTLSTALHYTPGKGYYEEYRYDEAFEDYGLPQATSSDIIRRRWLDNRFYGMTFSLAVDKTNWNMIIGGAFNRYDGDHFGEVTWAAATPFPTPYRYYFNNGDKRDLNIYYKSNVQIGDRLNVFTDLQYRLISYLASGIENKLNAFAVDEQFSFLNPKTGLIFSIDENRQVYSSLSIANREPVRDDFVDNLMGAPEPESMFNLEAGYRETGKQYTVNANYYLMYYDNQLVLTGQVNDVGASIRTNVDKSYRTGIELEGLVKLSGRLQWNANLTLSQNKIKNFTEVLYDYGVNFDEYNEVRLEYRDTDISFSPGVVAGSALSFVPVTGADITLLSKYVGKQYLDNTSNDARSIDPYLVNDIRLRYTWKPKLLREINVGLLINNIFNKAYESNGYTWGYRGGGTDYRENYYFPQAGTNLMGMVTIKI